MPASFGAIALPASIILLILRQKGPADALVKAGATTPETARRPASVGMQSRHLVESLERSGLIVPVGDGRYYVDLPRLRRRTRRIFVAAALLASAGLGCVAWAYLS
ncbi:MAG TPA: hypothetical protein PKC43_01730 [Phycisphaerales bacterium]|nr:hypothetical protein [Phycisphaerales bacterium]HMP36145.1 hypothetical protein [Phycisphaerales bacterium]